MTNRKTYQNDLHEMLSISRKLGEDYGELELRKLRRKQAISAKNQDDVWCSVTDESFRMSNNVAMIVPSPSTQFLSEDKEIPYFTASLILGVMLALIAVLVGWKIGIEFLPLLAIYCSVGSAVTLGTTVFLTLSSGRKRERKNYNLPKM